jgi:hypothetical protein
MPAGEITGVKTANAGPRRLSFLSRRLFGRHPLISKYECQIVVDESPDVSPSEVQALLGAAVTITIAAGEYHRGSYFQSLINSVEEELRRAKGGDDDAAGVAVRV